MYLKIMTTQFKLTELQIQIIQTIKRFCIIGNMIILEAFNNIKIHIENLVNTIKIINLAQIKIYNSHFCDLLAII